MRDWKWLTVAVVLGIMPVSVYGQNSGTERPMPPMQIPQPGQTQPPGQQPVMPSPGQVPSLRPTLRPTPPRVLEQPPSTPDASSAQSGLRSGGGGYYSPKPEPPPDCNACHDRTPSMVGTNDEPEYGFEDGYLSPRSWAGWWEVNRDRYLTKARVDNAGPLDSHQPSAAVIESLTSAMKSGPVEVRREAVLAIARMRVPGAFPILKEMTGDADTVCALRAWGGIGLLETPEAIGFLNTVPDPASADRIGWTMAVGLCSKPPQTVWAILKKQAEDPKCHLEARRLAIWALRVHNPPDTHELFQRIVRTSDDVWLVSEAMLGIGLNPTPLDITSLTAIIKSTPEARDLPAMVAKMPRPVNWADGPEEMFSPYIVSNGSSAVSGVASLRAGRAQLQIARPNYAVLRDAAIRALSLDEKLTELDEPYQAIANQMVRPDISSNLPERSKFYPQDVIPLSKVSTMNQYNLLSDRMEVSPLAHPGSPSASNRARRPGRGLAAISVGLMLDHLGGGRQEVEQLSVEYSDAAVRRGNEITLISARYVAQHVPPDDALMTQLRNKSGPTEFRSAVALAFGLGGQKQRASDLKTFIESLGQGEESIFGYGLLSLGLWGDEDALKYAQPLAGPQGKFDIAKVAAAHGKQPMQLEELMGRRAAAQALAVLGKPEAIGMLVSQWGKHPALDVELARAIAWCDRPKTTTSPAGNAEEFVAGLTSLLSDKNTSRELAASAAASLGMYFANKDTSPRLRLLVENSNFRARGWALQANGKMNVASLQRQVLALGNPSYYLGALAQWPAPRGGANRGR